MSEAALQKAVNDALMWKRVPFVRMDYRCRCCGNILNAGMAGIPDNVIPALGIELKTQRGRLSAAQKDLHGFWEAHGIPVEVCRSLPEVLAALKKHGHL